MMILVTGATGQLGTSTIDFLLKATPANEIAVLARDKEKAQDLINKGVDVRIGSYQDYESLVKAFKGVDKLFLISSGEVTEMEAHHKNAIDAAIEANVKHIVYTGSNIKETENSPIAIVINSHRNTIDYLKDSGSIYTILKNNLYTNIVPGFLGSEVLDSGVVFPSGNGKVAFATRENMAEAAARILTEDGHENKTYEMSGTHAYSFEDIANLLAEISGKKIDFTSPTKEEFATKLKNAGYPEIVIGGMAGFAEAIKQNSFDKTSEDLENLLQRKPTGLKDYLQSVYSK